MAVSAELVQGAQSIQNAMGIPASVIMAQYYLESGERPDSAGTSTLAKEYNNYFGIKGTGTAGSVTLPTTEHGGGGAYTTAAQFAAYETPLDGITAYAKTIANRYISPYLEGAVTVEDYVQAIHASPYATDTSYDDKLNNLIDKYNLTQYDTTYKTYNAAGLSSLELAADSIGNYEEIVQTTTKDSWVDSLKEWAVDSIAEPLTTTTFVILFAVLAVVFFMRAFPAAAPAVESTSNSIQRVRKARKKKKG